MNAEVRGNDGTTEDPNSPKAWGLFFVQSYQKILNLEIPLFAPSPEPNDLDPTRQIHLPISDMWGFMPDGLLRSFCFNNKFRFLILSWPYRQRHNQRLILSRKFITILSKSRPPVKTSWD